MTTNNIDPQEVAKFNAMAADWWDPKGSMQPLHLLNPLRFSYIQQWAEVTGKTVIDVGCGGGLLTEALAQYAQKTVGIDVSEAALAVAKQHAEQKNLGIDYQAMTVEDFAKQHSQQFDRVTCLEMLEHVPDPKSVISACANLLKPGGFVFFSTLHRNPKAYALAILGAEYLLKLLPKGTHRYANFIRPSELNRWANDANLELLNIQGVNYNPFKKTFRLSGDVSVNYLTCYQKRD